MNILPDISRSKRNQTMEFCLLTEYKTRNSFLQKSCRKRGRETTTKPLFVFFLIFYEVNASGLQFQYYRQASIWHTIKTKSKRPYTIHQEI